MHLTQIKENYPVISHVTLLDIKHLIYDNEVLTGMDSNILIYLLHIEAKAKINTLPGTTLHT